MLRVQETFVKTSVSHSAGATDTMIKPVDIEALDDGERHQFSDLEKQIDEQLVATKGQVSIRIDSGWNFVWYKVARIYREAGWSVVLANAVLTIQHPVFETQARAFERPDPNAVGWEFVPSS
jgi:hypothetical protein